jgi:diguanylate cyclase (GGDEF)-like protein/PAS domain S-box-containing protein
MNTSRAYAEASFRWILTDPPQVMSVSDGVQSLLGYRPAEFLAGRVALQNLVHPHDDDILALIFEQTPHAPSRPLNIRARDAAGDIQCLKAVCTKSATPAGVVLELSLQNAKGIAQANSGQPMMANFRAMMENTDDYIYFKDRNHVFTGASQTLVQITAPAEHWSDLIGLTDYDVFPEELADVYYRLEKQVFAGVAVAHEEQRTRTKAGREGWVDNRKYPIKDDSGAIIGLFGIARDITDVKNAELSEHLHHELLNGILSSALDGYWLVGAQGQLVDVNAAACNMLGYSRDEMLALSVPAIEAADTPFDVQHRIESMKDSGGARFESQHRCKDGGILDVEVAITYLPAHDSFSVFIRDITERKFAEEQLRIAAAAFNSQEGILITSAHQKIMRVNRTFTAITGYSEDEVIGQNVRILSSGRHDAAFYKSMWESILATGTWQGEIWNRRKNGEIFPEWQTITAVKSDEGEITHFVASFADITSRKAAETEITHLAFYDPLTRLPNRRLLQDRLKQALISSGRNKKFGVLMFVDLDNFKNLNDTLGHHFGDMLLEQVAHRLSETVREGDTVARLGGDEFVVMLEGICESGQEAATHSEVVAKKILAALSRPYTLGSHPYNNSCSIGITLFSDKQETVDELLKRADLAMYQAKASGRNALRFFDPAMQAVVTAVASLDADLREAVAYNQFILYYQPQVEGKGRLTGAEALIRWQHPVRGFVSPFDFIGLAEDTGLILPIGHWVLKTACLQLAQWANAAHLQYLTIAVNVSAKQFQQANFVQEVADVLAQTGANPRCLKLELTESLLVSNVDDIIAKMAALRSMGISFSLDDFGTGYSSLAYLKRLPLAQLKIDQRFVRDMLKDSNDAAIARMVIALSESMGISVIAEGVEEESQRAMLEQLGCRHYQGYLFGRPMTATDFEIYAAAQKASSAPVT